MNLGVIRLSDLKGESQTGPVRQREAITKKYAELGISPEDIIWAEDLDVSAFHVSPLKRPMLRRAFNDLPPGSTVIFYRLDRFVRRVFPDFSDMVSFAADRKLTLHSATETLDLLKLDGVMVATLMAFVAQKESENTSARVKNTQEYFRRIGRWTGSRLPYGYRPVQVEGKPGWWLELDEETAGILREIVRRVIDGQSVNQVTNWLNEQGVLVPTDQARAFQGKPRLCKCGHNEHDDPCQKIHKCLHRKRVDGGRRFVKLHEYDECSEPCPAYKPRLWRRESLHEMLRSPALLGHTVENRGQVYLGEDGMPVPFAEPGVLDSETFQQLQDRLEERGYKKVRTNSDSLLLNVAHCDCRAPLYTKYTPSRDKTSFFDYYQPRFGSCPDKRKSIRIGVLDALVQRELLKTLGGLEVLREEKTGEHMNAIRAERNSVGSQIVALTQEMFVKGRPRENHNELLAELQARHAELTAALDAEDVPETRWVPTGELFRDHWASLDTLGRRMWLMDAGVTVTAVRGAGVPKVEFMSRRTKKRAFTMGNDGDVWAIVYLGNFGEMLRRAEGKR